MALRLLVFLIAALIAFPSNSSASSLNEEIKEALLKAAPWERSVVEVVDIEVPGLKEDESFDSVDVELPNGVRSTGKVSYKLTITKKGKEARTLWGSARIKVFRGAVVALRSIKAKTKISAEDVGSNMVEINEAPDALSSIDEAVGMIARRPITAGSIVKREYIKPEVVIKRGQRVTVNLEGSSLRVKSNGVASQDGHMGGTIAVKTASGREVEGIVAGPGVITIGF